MNLTQRFILMVGLVGILHTSMVPPVQQLEQGTCRYHEFTVRSKPFTRTHAVAQGDVAALFGEYGIILSGTGILYLVAGLIGGTRRESK